MTNKYKGRMLTIAFDFVCVLVWAFMFNIFDGSESIKGIWVIVALIYVRQGLSLAYIRERDEVQP